MLSACIAYESKDEVALTSLAAQKSKAQPQNPAAKLIIGCYFHMKHQLDDAMQCYHQVLQVTPEDSLVWSLLGQLFDWSVFVRVDMLNGRRLHWPSAALVSVCQ